MPKVKHFSSYSHIILDFFKKRPFFRASKKESNIMNIFYHISKDKYLISDLELCKASPSSFDVKLWEIANNEEL